MARGGFVPGRRTLIIEPGDGECYIPLASDSARSQAILAELRRRLEDGTDG
jgi:hypothetical protein